MSGQKIVHLVKEEGSMLLLLFMERFGLVAIGRALRGTLLGGGSVVGNGFSGAGGEGRWGRDGLIAGGGEEEKWGSNGLYPSGGEGERWGRIGELSKGEGMGWFIKRRSDDVVGTACTWEAASSDGTTEKAAGVGLQRQDGQKTAQSFQQCTEREMAQWSNEVGVYWKTNLRALSHVELQWVKCLRQ